MIVVVADDLTGAAEIAGIGCGCGMTAELQRGFCSKTDAQLLVIDTDTRSLSPQQAGQKIRHLAQGLNASGLPIEWIYKKTDSVLRGPVGCELETLREEMHAARVLLVPANPSKGRIVRDGIYLIRNQLLSETEFARDPEYPAATSNVLKMQGLFGFDQVCCLDTHQPFPNEGIIIGQAETTDDLMRWAQRIDEQTLPAGAGEYFEAILKNKGFSKKPHVDEIDYQLNTKTLYVCGSSSNASRQALRKAESLGMKVCRMPAGLFRPDCDEQNTFLQWTEEVIGSLQYSSRVIVAIDREIVPDVAVRLRGLTAKLVQAVICEIPLSELWVEGGATASAIADSFGWVRFAPCFQLEPGIVRMKVMNADNVYLTAKPGSYAWPAGILNFFSKGFYCAP
ncbi:MAG TPA: four-carbon acid sugar kinase family protein [Anaerohalosphaeraceae bacterium]|nr:four-carbon acid sugar kinase family protein [Phycisphaerae bacterium]HOK95059.1 four-carbon acid sugar kinase family protein [Anaerohalosphaeraceae bacterium]HOL31772.1 four-carbon acid sugar kinase family protein [Anaerohalosphaeraceae bacterium]HOM75164.1 four-carbon acid sugar kinase family protein [Anaerohalosphaeraceae bacterium]HPC63546.1 four-carbon acid sugar kinase family protein [Anaerohalosphaeraceae bacterium]